MSEAAILGRALGLARDHTPHDAELLKLLVSLQRRATVLLFAFAGRDAAGLARWDAGDYHAPVRFISKSDGVRALHMLVRDKAIAVELVNSTGADAARKTLERGVAEIARYAPALADALDAGRCIRKDVVLFRHTGDTPHILTERVRNRSDSGNSLRADTTAGMMEAEFTTEA